MKIIKYFASLLALVGLAATFTSCENELNEFDAKQNYYFQFSVNPGSLNAEQVEDLYSVLGAAMKTDSAGIVANPIYDTRSYAETNYDKAAAGGDKEMAEAVAMFADAYNCENFNLSFNLLDENKNVIKSGKVFSPAAIAGRANYTVNVDCSGNDASIAAQVEAAVNTVYGGLALNNVTKQNAFVQAICVKGAQLWNALNPLFNEENEIVPTVKVSVLDANGKVVASKTIEGGSDFMYEIPLHENFTKKVILSIAED